ncbi:MULTISPECIES: hypothetical protein [unclassified Mesorhizobium]|nr:MULTISPECIES: hypothetical protein [unclassified Mesorhizobium]
MRTSRKTKQRPWWHLSRDEVFKVLAIAVSIILTLLSKCGG